MTPEIAKPHPYNWYVTFTFTHPENGHGGGSFVLHSQENWFPIRSVLDGVKERFGTASATIQSWRRISDRQAKELLNEP